MVHPVGVAAPTHQSPCGSGHQADWLVKGIGGPPQVGGPSLLRPELMGIASHHERTNALGWGRSLVAPENLSILHLPQPSENILAARLYLMVHDIRPRTCLKSMVGFCAPEGDRTGRSDDRLIDPDPKKSKGCTWQMGHRRRMGHAHPIPNGH